MSNSYFKQQSRKKMFIHFILIIGAIFTLTPFVWMILTSFKTLSESMQVPPKIFPSEWSFDSFRKALSTLPFAKLYVNTITFTVVTTVGQVVLCSLAGYVFARIEFWGNNLLFLAVLSILMIPTQIFLVPQFEIISKWNLANTIRALIIPNLFSAFGTFLMRQYFMGIPDQLEEAARLDGCNPFQIFYKIMLPLVKPGIIALGISTALYAWNTLMWPLIINTSTDKMTLSAGLASFQDQHGTDFPVLMAGTILSIWPMIITFILFQKEFIEGIATTGGK